MTDVMIAFLLLCAIAVIGLTLFALYLSTTEDNESDWWDYKDDEEDRL